MSEQRRRAIRRHLVYYLKVVDAKTNKPKGRLGDLSAEGLLLLTKSAFKTGKTYRLRVEMPEDDPDPRAFVSNVLCVWTRKDMNPDVTLVGFRFADLSEAATEAIGRLVKAYGFFDGQPLDDEDE